MFLMAAWWVNIVLDIPVREVVLKLGVAGAAIATVFSQVVSAGMVTQWRCSASRKKHGSL